MLDPVVVTGSGGGGGSRVENALERMEEERKSLEAAEAQLEAASQELVVRSAQAYFDVLAAQDSLAFVQAQKAAVSEQLASAKRNFEVGTATITDTREAQARFDQTVAQEIAADNELRVKRLALDQLVGQTGVAPRGLVLPVALPNLAPETPDGAVNLTTSPCGSILPKAVTNFCGACDSLSLFCSSAFAFEA